ncbi:MAG: FHA domain-containing protein [Pseudomonadota bacterium]
MTSSVASFEEATVAGEPLSIFGEADEKIAVLLLVDTSDPARQAAVRKNAEHVTAIVAEAGANDVLALASFDSNLNLIADFGSSNEAIVGGASELQAIGKTTELYRNIKEAVNLLRQTEADRRVLIVFSDGLAEDYAYDHDDVVKTARDDEVIIHAIGYPRSVAKSVALQTIRRLSDETGGQYVQASYPELEIPPTVAPKLFTSARSGGRLRFDLEPLAEQGAIGAIDVTLSFQTESQGFLVLAPVTLPGPDAEGPTAPSPSASSSSQPIAPPQIVRVSTGGENPSLWPWFAIVIGLLLVVIVAVVLQLKRGREKPQGEDAQSKRPLAFLMLGEERHVIRDTPWRIGRSRNNDLPLLDSSVSRLHAEIRRNEDGALTLNDLGSLNGVFVNDGRVETFQLREGDKIDIGDVRMTFTLKDETYAKEDATVMVSTRAPVGNL